MRFLLRFSAAIFCCSTLFCSTTSFAATMTERFDAAAKRGQHTYVMFYRADDAATKQMASTIRSHVAETGDQTTWVIVNVRDRNEAQLVKRFDAARIPLPATFGVAPNGAISGVFRQKVSPAQLSGAILTPKYSEMVKALQSQKIAVVCMMPSANSQPPAGMSALVQDPNFKGIVQPITAFASDSSEANFFSRMQIDRNLTSPVVLMFAPPGTHLGTFPANVSGPQLAQTLHKSGKCNCSKCQSKR